MGKWCCMGICLAYLSGETLEMSDGDTESNFGGIARGAGLGGW